jgi:hypothetical protein
MVKFISDKTGRFFSRPYYQPEELDHACEAIITSFLLSRYGVVKFPISTDDIIRLIEQRVNYLDTYADLSEFGETVEGVTEFFLGENPTVKISNNLMEDNRRENRLRTTLTHEFGHVHFHKSLFEKGHDQLSLIAFKSGQDIIVCKREKILESPRYDWMEWQAGYACGAFLMPKSHLLNYIDQFTDRSISNSGNPVNQNGVELISSVAERFQVSKDAARVRLKQLKLLGTENSHPRLF